jgi:hypothetical protein
MKISNVLTKTQFAFKYIFWGTFWSFLICFCLFIIYHSKAIFHKFIPGSKPLYLDMKQIAIGNLDVYIKGVEVTIFIKGFLSQFGIQLLFILMGLFLIITLIVVLSSGTKVRKQRVRGAELYSKEDYRKHFQKIYRKKTKGYRNLTRFPKDIPKNYYRKNIFGRYFYPSEKFCIGEVPFPEIFRNKNVFGQGGQGTGKTVLIKQFFSGQRFKRRIYLDFYNLFFGESQILLICFFLLIAVSFVEVTIFKSLNLPFAFNFFIFVNVLPLFYIFFSKKEIICYGISDEGGFVFDRQNLTGALYSEARKDILYDPDDDRSVRYNIFNDLTDDASIKAFWEGFFPSGDDFTKDIWPEFAQTIGEAVTKIIIGEAKIEGRLPTMKDLYDFVREAGNFSGIGDFRRRVMPFPETHGLIVDLVGKDDTFEPGRTHQSAFLTFTNGVKAFLDPVWSLPPRNDVDEKFSIKDFIKELKDPDNTQKRWLFLKSITKNDSRYRKIYTAMFNLMIAEAACLEKETEFPRINFIIDEFGAFNKIKFFPELVNTTRKFGGCVMCFTQTANQIRRRYGNEAANEIIGGFQSSIVFRVNDPHQAQMISNQEIGSSESIVETTSININEASLAGGISNQQSLQSVKLVLAEQIKTLKDLEMLAMFTGQPWYRGMVLPFFPLDKMPGRKSFIPAKYNREVFDINTKIEPEPTNDIGQECSSQTEFDENGNTKFHSKKQPKKKSKSNGGRAAENKPVRSKALTEVKEKEPIKAVSKVVASKKTKQMKKSQNKDSINSPAENSLAKSQNTKNSSKDHERQKNNPRQGNVKSNETKAAVDLEDIFGWED